ELTADPVQLTPKPAAQAYDLVLDRRGGFLALMRRLLDVDAIPDYESVVERAFNALATSADAHHNAEQTRFLRVVKDRMLEAGPLTKADLYEEPFKALGRNAVGRLFDQDQIDAIVQLTQRLAS
ncbi:MAG: type I restriction-modification enzyme R subunit C-terminal domain-containing protein, partial [Dehalococcoidia bacterium]